MDRGRRRREPRRQGRRRGVLTPGAVAGDPVSHVLAGPNGSGKSTFVEHVLEAATGLPFVNADAIAAATWPGAELEHAYEASERAAAERDRVIEARRSFLTETVFSHPSKSHLVQRLADQGYVVHLHVMLVPVDLSVARVAERVTLGGHDVPETKIRDRYARLWDLIGQSVSVVGRATFYDNTSADKPFRIVAEYEHGRPIRPPAWPSWTPAPLRTRGDGSAAGQR